MKISEVKFEMGSEELILNQNTYNPNFVTMFFSLLVVIGLIYFTGIIYKKLIKIKLDDTSQDDCDIQILKTISLGQGKNLHVIQIKQSRFLIGATQYNISYIKELENIDN